MIISPERRIIFIHLHKCGGTSVERSYEGVARPTDLILGSTATGEMIQSYYQEKFSLGKHSHVDAVVAALGRDEYLKYATFALVRHPCRVYESFYLWIARIFEHHARRTGVSMRKLKRLVRRGSDQYHFAGWGASIAYAHADSFPDFMDYALRHNKLPKSTFHSRLRLDDDQIAAQHVYRLEDIDRFWEAFEEAADAKMERMHENRSRPTDLEWDARHLQKIRQIHQPDFDRFGYQ